MSIKTTHHVTRQFAINAILSKLYSCNDTQLENILEEAIHNGFYNFSIVSSIEPDDMFYIDNLNDLPPYNDAH